MEQRPISRGYGRAANGGAQASSRNLPEPLTRVSLGIVPKLCSASFIASLLLACAGERPGPDDPCTVATGLRNDALRQFSTECTADSDCVVFRAEIECSNVQLGDCGTLVNRSSQRKVDWDRIQRDICSAVEGTDFGCAVNVSCAALSEPRCEQGFCAQHSAASLAP